MAWGQIGLLQATAGFFTWVVVMADNGFWPSRLVGIRKAWDAAAINDLADSYGQEWVRKPRTYFETIEHVDFVFSDLSSTKTVRIHGLRLVLSSSCCRTDCKSIDL